jgi:membrane protease YdiL (CAAX protease family)
MLASRRPIIRSVVVLGLVALGHEALARQGLRGWTLVVGYCACYGLGWPLVTKGREVHMWARSGVARGVCHGIVGGVILCAGVWTLYFLLYGVMPSPDIERDIGRGVCMLTLVAPVEEWFFRHVLYEQGRLIHRVSGGFLLSVVSFIALHAQNARQLWSEGLPFFAWYAIGLWIISRSGDGILASTIAHWMVLYMLVVRWPL